MGNTVTTPALTAVAAGTAATHGHTTAGAKHGDDSPSFDTVLNDRPKAQPASGPAGAANQDKQGRPVAASADKDHDHAKEPENGSAAQGEPQTLPQIALYIAAQANGALPDQGKRADTPADAKSADAIKAALVDHAARPGDGKTGKASAASTLTASTRPDADAAPMQKQARDTETTADARQSARAASAATQTAAAMTHAQPARHGHGGHGAAEQGLASTHDIASAGQTRQTASRPATELVSGHAPRPQAHPEVALAPALETAPRGKQRDNAQDKGTASVLAAAPVAPGGPASPTALATGAAAQPGVAAPLQSPQWAGQFAQQFVSLTHSAHPSGSHSAQLRLDPPNLGPLHVSININDNIAHAIFTSPHAAVRHAVENALPQLQQQLAQSGISLGQTSVNDQGARHDSPAGGSSSNAFRAPRAVDGLAGDAGAAVAMPAARARTTPPDALVDIFA
jgi:flagellar hook-length control protein FliK